MHAQYWNSHEPKAIADGQVTIQAHDFFTPQPIKDADIFLLRYVLHDWPNAKSVEVLKRLREAAVPGKTKVVVIDSVIQYACTIDQKKVRGAEDIVFEGSDKKSEVPVGLLANLGKAQGRSYYLDMTYDFQLDRSIGCNSSDKISGCWRRLMGRSARWVTILK